MEKLHFSMMREPSRMRIAPPPFPESFPVKEQFLNVPWELKLILTAPPKEGAVLFVKVHSSNVGCACVIVTAPPYVPVEFEVNVQF
jgi:hypothetical protein